MGLSAPSLKGNSSFNGNWDPLAVMKTGIAIPTGGKAAARPNPYSDMEEAT